MDKTNTFQMVVLAVFIVLAALGVFFFATFNGAGEKSFERVIIWGTIDNTVMNPFIRDIKLDRPALNDVVYVQKNERTYTDDIVNALAAGVGPDLFMLPHSFLLKQEDKITPIPYDSFSEREFKDTFLEEGELFLNEEGILALPFIIDPLIMYWNRDLFSKEGISSPPKFWDELLTLSPVLTKKDNVGNIIESTVAFGEYRNVTNAKEILSAIFMQSGTPITSRGTDRVHSDLTGQFGYVTVPAEAALRFYTEFSNPIKTVYSWNRGLQSSRQEFLSGDLAIYFGFASELQDIRELNPNLNFDIAEFPQSRDSGKKITYGNMTGLAISKQSTNKQGAFLTATALIESESISLLSSATNLPPVRRDLLLNVPTDSYGGLVYVSAVISKAWLDPEAEETDLIFKDMVESVTSGIEDLSSAVGIADKRMENLLRSR